MTALDAIKSNSHEEWEEFNYKRARRELERKGESHAEEICEKYDIPYDREIVSDPEPEKEAFEAYLDARRSLEFYSHELGQLGEGSFGDLIGLMSPVDTSDEAARLEAKIVELSRTMDSLKEAARPYGTFMGHIDFGGTWRG